jgi:hypothetical protein
MHRSGQSIKLLLDPNKVSSPTFAKGSRNNSMYYYNLILAIYEPLLDIRTKQDQEKTPRQIVNDASKFLQTLVRYTTYGVSTTLVPIRFSILCVMECLECNTSGSVAGY